MQAFLQIVASNALLVVVLAAGVTLLGRIWKNPLYLHLLWLFVLLKLVTPPVVTFHVPLPAGQTPPAIEKTAANRPSVIPSSFEVAGQETASTTAGANGGSDRRSPSNGIESESPSSLSNVAAVPAAAGGHGMRWLAILGWAWGLGIVAAASDTPLPHPGLPATAAFQQGRFRRRD